MPQLKTPPKLRLDPEKQKVFSLNGHAAINTDTGLINYDYPKTLPFIVKGTLSGEKIRAFAAENRDRLDFISIGAQLSTRNLDKKVLAALILDMEKVLSDLKQINEVTQLTEAAVNSAEAVTMKP